MASDIERLEIDANGFTFSARAAGPHDGRPLLLLHGFPETSWSWRVLLTQLGRPDIGPSPQTSAVLAGRPPDGHLRLCHPHLVDDVLAIADTMEMATFDLVGTTGGNGVLVTAARHSDRVRSLCVVSTPHPEALRGALVGDDPDQVERSGYMEMFRRPDEPERLLLGEDGSGSGLRTLFESSGLDPTMADEYVACLPSLAP